MAVFEYRAYEGARRELTGSLVADTPRHARDLLRGRGLVVTDVSEVHSQRAFRLPRLRRARSAELVDFVRELSTLLSVGVPLVEALDTVSRGRTGRSERLILALRDRVSAGLSLAEALREFPEVFDPMVRNVCLVGEESGELDTVLARLSDYLERSERLRGRLTAALIYPGIVFAMAVVTSVLLMTVVVPNVLEPLRESGAELPLVTRVVERASELLVDGWWAFLLGLAALGGAFFWVLRTEWGRLVFDRLVLRLPLLGEVVRKQAVVRVAVVLATLLRSGVVFIEALRIAQGSVGNLVLRRALEDAERTVSSGQDVGESLERTGAFPPTVVQVFSLGEQSGRLDEVLERLASDYDHQVEQKAQRLAAALEPLLVLILALLVGFIAFATILPILEAGHVL